jgi:acyl carrier protein
VKFPPRGETEEAIAAMWRDVLGVTEINRDDRLLELGGHSLLAVQIASRLQKRFGIRPPLRTVMMDTLSSLAAELGGTDSSVTAEEATAEVESAAARQTTDAFYFESGKRQLFGILTRPAFQSKTTGILICQTWGMEYTRSYMALRTFADRMARSGFPVMRFDYSCTGDSSGYSNEARVTEWLQNIRTAADELRARTGIANLCIVGLRLGALLAARVVSEGLDATQVVLWDAPPSGAGWLQELKRLNLESHQKWNSRRSPRAKLQPPSATELLGIPLSPQFEQDLLALHAANLSNHGVNVLHALSRDTPTVSSSSETTLRMADPGFWSRVSWLTTPWNPATSINVIAEELRTRLI